MPSLTVLRYEPRRDLDSAMVGVATVRLAGLIVVELVVRRLPAGGFRVVWPPSTHAAETEIARGIEATTMRLLAERGDLPAGRGDFVEASTPARRRARMAGDDEDDE